jgi:hypothetical protein
MKYLLNHLRCIYGEPVLITKEIFNYIIEIICFELKKDSYTCRQSLISKWLPREKSKKFGWQVKYIAIEYFCGKNVIRKFSRKYVIKYCIQYRKLISKLNQNLNTLEIYQCKNEWNMIKFENVTSIALLRQSVAFLRNESNKNYQNYVNKLASHKTNMKCVKVDVGELVKKAIYAEYSKEKNPILNCINVHWNNVGNITPRRYLVMVDTSNSLTFDQVCCAIGIGLKFAEASELGKRLLIFSSIPEWVNLSSRTTLTQMMSVIPRELWGLKSNFESALQTLLDTFMKTNASNYHIQEITIVVISGNDNVNEIVENKVEKLFSLAGMRTPRAKPYKPCNIVHWNLSTNNGYVPFFSNFKLIQCAGHNPFILNSKKNIEKNIEQKSIKHCYYPLQMLKNKRYYWIYQSVEHKL